ncbi:YggS family pyridoxal phosphate-dependent enzyme [bacterium]|nr:YggS family pyridoxal phosphate-dependent enzyme [bacterium]
MESAATPLDDVRARIAQACKVAGREADEVTLIAISKTHPAERIVPLLEQGQRVFGENRVQEAEEKFPQLKSASRYELHFIGHLQRNKAKKAVELFDMIQSVDSFRLAKELNAHAEQNNKKIPVLLQFNVANEPSKTGFLLRDIDDIEERFEEYRYLDVQGLMAIPPYYEDQQEVRPYFQTMRELYKYFQEQPVFFNSLKYLSMGMSHDYYQAVREGANIIRLGEALFGPRSKREAHNA